MDEYLNTRTRNLIPYVPGEQPRDRNFIKLNTNENPYPPSPAVIGAIKKAADEGLRFYPDPACTVFREAVAKRYNVKPEQVFAGNGSDEVLAFVFGAFFERGTAAVSDAAAGTDTAAVSPVPLPILFPDITYSFYPVYAGLWGVPFRTVPLTGDFSVNSNDYTIPSGGVILPNPNAPTGKALPLADILGIAEYLEGQKKVLVVDEAYVAFGAESAVPYINKHPNLLTVHTLSKSASLAGLRLGFAIGGEKLIAGLCRIRDSFNSYTVDRLALAGGAAAVLDADYYFGINQKIIATRDRVSAELTRMNFAVIPSSANFIFIKAPGVEGAEFFSLLREKGILVRHFNKPRISDYLRVSMGTDEDMNIFLQICGDINKK